MRLSIKKRVIINLEVSNVILFPVPRRWSRKNGLGLYDNSVDISFYAYFTTVSRDYRVPIRSRPGGDEKKKRKGGWVSVRAHSHPGSDRNDLNAREAPEECRCAYAPHLPRDDLFVLASWDPPVTRENTLWRNPGAVRHASIFINVTAGPPDSDRLTLRLTSRDVILARSQRLGGLEAKPLTRQNLKSVLFKKKRKKYHIFIYLSIISLLLMPRQIEYWYWAILINSHGARIFVFVITNQYRVIERYLMSKTQISQRFSQIK